MQPICLTFDNGPEPETTPHVLDVLARRGIRATFFVVCEKLRDPARRALAERIAAAGHRVGNHTLTHGTPLGHRGATDALEEIAEAERLLGELNRERIFRPNGGGGLLGPHLLNKPALEHLRREKYTVVLWNAVPKDWEPIDDETWAERALKMCRESKEPLVLVLHDLRPGAMKHLDKVLGTLEAEGAQFITDFPDCCVPIRKGDLLWEANTITNLAEAKI